MDRDKTPLDEDGKRDYESMGALNTVVMQDHLKRLLAGEEVQLLHYNFKTGMSEPGEVMDLVTRTVDYLGGIHGLNPELLGSISPDQTFGIYVSCLTQLVWIAGFPQRVPADSLNTAGCPRTGLFRPADH